MKTEIETKEFLERMAAGIGRAPLSEQVKNALVAILGSPSADKIQPLEPKEWLNEAAVRRTLQPGRYKPELIEAQRERGRRSRYFTELAQNSLTSNLLYNEYRNELRVAYNKRPLKKISDETERRRRIHEYLLSGWCAYVAITGREYSVGQRKPRMPITDSDELGKRRAAALEILKHYGEEGRKAFETCKWEQSAHDADWKVRIEEIKKTLCDG
jgi:hypothetical protein